MKSVALHNLGCKVNAYEIDVMQQLLQEKGYKIVPFDEKADIYIVNTCTVTNIADRKSRQMLHKAKKMNPEAIVVATGCYVQADSEIVEKDEAIDLAIGNNKKGEVVRIIEEYLSEHRASDTMIDINHTDRYEELELKKTADHTRAYIKVQDGCNQFCSYCIIPYARGRVRSRRPEQVIEEVEGLVRSGYKEIVLTGIHLSSYGIDFIHKDSEDYLEQGMNEKDIAQKRGYLLQLIGSLNELEGLERIRLGSLEPRIITEDFALSLSKLDKICPHFHLSLQSGSDSVLKRMNRKYNTQEYANTVEILRRYFNDPAITTDVIVGFPGETREEFEETRKFVSEIGFFEMHIFKYSKRKGTTAAVMKDQVSDQDKNERSEQLLAIESQMSETYRLSMIGKTVMTLFEEKKQIGDRMLWIGHTPEYVKIGVESDEDLANRILPCMVSGPVLGGICIAKTGNF